MQYYKTVIDEMLESIGTINADGDGNITAEEYDSLLTMIRQMPAGKCIHDNSDGTYSYIDAPPHPDPEPTEEDYAQAGHILMGEAD